MTAPLSGLSALTDRYDVLLCDIWGVIHNGRKSFPGPCAALARFRAGHGPVILISNSPRPRDSVARQLDGLGVPRESWTDIVSSGDATRALLALRAPGPALKIGPEDAHAALYEGLGLSFAGVEEAAFIACTGPNDDLVETPEDYRGLLTQAAARGLPMICANPDIVVQHGDRLIYCAGALAQLYETLGGKVEMAGKPHPAIYGLALAKAEAELGRPLSHDRVLCIGDGVATDVKGANAQGLDVLFIARGIHGGEAIGPDGIIPSAVDALLAKQGAKAEWARADLAW